MSMFKVETSGASTGAPWTDGSRTPWLVAAGLGALLLVVTLGIAIFDEPYHIDELRQVGYYEQGFAEIARSAASQQQPPLDYWIGMLMRDLMGRPSDAAERAPAALFAMTAAMGISTLLWWSGRVSVAWIPPVIAALSPLYLTFGAYTRPYSLPMALMICFIIAAEGWRRSRRLWMLSLVFAIAVLLPLSRTVEPSLFLACVVIVLGIMLTKDRAERWVIPILIAGVFGLIASLPVFSAMSKATADFRTEAFNEYAVVAQRVSEALGVIGSEQPSGIMLLVLSLLVAVVIVRRILRHGSTEAWWFLPLLATPLASVLVFGLVANPAVPFFTRYGFFVVLPLATGYALAAALPKGRVLGAIVGLFTIGLIFLAIPATVQALSTTDNPDYRSASLAVNEEIATGTEVLYEEGTTVRNYRNPYFPGIPRYTSGPIYESFSAARDRHPIGDGPIAVLSLGERLHAPGWVAFFIADQFSVYSPRADVRWGQRELGESLRSLCESGDVEDYGYLCVISAQALAAAGDRRSAEVLLEATEERARKSGVLEYFGTLFDPLHVLG